MSPSPTAKSVRVEQQRTPTRTLLPCFWLAVAALTFFAAFVLPFFFPLPTPVLSRAYTAGANNRVAAIAIAAIGVAVALACWRFKIGRRTAPVRRAGMPRRWLLYACGVAVLFTATLGFFVVRAGHFYSDEGYFLTQLRTGLDFHGRLYRDFEFPYGPAYYAWPALWLRALAPLGVPRAAAYVFALAALQCLGLGLLFYTVNALPMRRPLQAWAFALVTFGALNPLLGLNYAIFRFVLPLALVVLLSRQPTPWRASLAAGLGVVAAFAVSPELGIAFGGAALAYALYRGLLGGALWLLVAAADAAGAAVFYAVGRHTYFETLGKFAAGGFNLILEPVPHIFGLLVAVVALAPFAVAAHLRRYRSEPGSDAAAAGCLLGLYVAALGMLPAALGRGDPLHTFSNGLGAYLLAFVAFDLASPRWRRLGVLGVALVFVYTQAQDFYFYRADLLHAIRRTPDPYDPAELSGLTQALGARRVLFPWNAPLQLSDRLTASGNFQPDYFCVMPLDADSERRKVAEMRATGLVMVPLGMPLAWQDEIDNEGFKYRLRFGYRYKARREPFFTGARMQAELRAHWSPADRFGNYELYRLVD